MANLPQHHVAKRVLVVDDHPDTAQTFAAILTQLGHHATFLMDPLEVLQTARVFQPEIVFLDITMPGLDGLELARLLRKRYGYDNLCLVAITAHNETEDRKRTREAGFDAHIVKPVDFGIVEAILTTLAETRQK